MEKNEKLFQEKHGETAGKLLQKGAGVQQKLPSLCVKCSCALNADCKSPVPGCCYDCWQQQEDIAEQLGQHVPEPCGAVEDKITPPKRSRCTWWQQQQREKGVSKKDALQTWKSMSAEERQAFKETLQVDSPASSSKSSSSPPQPVVGDVTSLADFQQKWQDFKQGLGNAANAHVYHLANYEDSFFLYVDVVVLLRLGVFPSAVAAEQELSDWSVNRKKISAVSKSLSESGNEVPLEVPAEFSAGQAHRGALTLQQKKDLLTHVQVMQRSNCVFTSKDAKKAMWKYPGFILWIFYRCHCRQ